MVVTFNNYLKYVLYFMASIIILCFLIVILCIYHINPYTDNYLIRNEIIWVIKLCTIIILFGCIVGGYYLIESKASTKSN